jgi:hypothetical protein
MSHDRENWLRVAKERDEIKAERDELRAALALGQENCDAVYDELRGDCDELRADVVRLATERDQLRAEAQRFQRLQRFIDTAAAEMKVGLITFGGIAELRAERDQLRAEVERFKSALEDPQKLHGHCLRTLNEGQIAHLFGERMTEIVNRAEKTEAAETVALANWNGALERALKAEVDLAALEQCHDDNCRAVVAIAAELATITAERDQLRDSSALSKTQRESVEWWVQFFSRRRFPQRGMFFIVPGDDPGEAVILHAHSGRKMDFRLDRGETWAQSRQIFEAALPHADEVALPAGTNPDEAPLPNVKAETRRVDSDCRPKSDQNASKLNQTRPNPLAPPHTP